ncbi:MAG TPA: hypothetical protein VE760_00395 [Acidimicrobiales bacterium]|nr:hypothetical protein [Acidimicrobiales bacterium]
MPDALMRSILGTDDRSEIETMVADWLRAYDGRGLTGLLSCEISVGAAIGLVLDDGAKAMLKVLAPRTPLAYARAMRRVQAHLHAADFPCPEPHVGPAPFGQSLAVLDEFVDVGEWPDGHDPVVRRAMAGALADLVRLARDVEDVEGLAASSMTPPPGRLWPIPHNVLFDFDATVAGAEWIDELAATAQKTLAETAGPPLVGHVDWSANNLRLAGEEVSAVYDWDSLRLEPEPVVVAAAATHFTYTEHLDVPTLPTQVEAQAFVSSYADCRGAPFTAQERAAVVAAATYSLAYTARCEHALEADREGDHDGARARLRAHGDRFLGT